MIRVLTPTYHRAEELRHCLASVTFELLSESFLPEELHWYIYDNNSCDEVKQDLTLLANKAPEFVTVVFGEKNIGKARALNKLGELVQDDDIVVSLDSDIEVVTGLFRNGVRIIKTFPIAAVAAWQLGNNHHRIEGDWHVTAGGFNYKSHATGMGIAGGCFFTMGSTWRKVGGYRVDRGLFGGNDGWFFHDAGLATNKPIWVCKELAVNHPDDKDQGYADWKKKAQEQQMTHDRCLAKKGYFDVGEKQTKNDK